MMKQLRHPTQRSRTVPLPSQFTPGEAAMYRVQRARNQEEWQKTRESLNQVSELLQSFGEIIYVLLAFGLEADHKDIQGGPSPEMVMELLRRMDHHDLNGNRNRPQWQVSEGQQLARLPDIYDGIYRLASVPSLQFGLVWSVRESDTFEMFCAGLSWGYLRAEVTHWINSSLQEQLDASRNAGCSYCGA